MFDFFRRDPRSRLQARYDQKMKAAVDAQRNGKIPLYAKLVAEAEAIAEKLDQEGGSSASATRPASSRPDG